jgi:hypothetical protein
MASWGGVFSTGALQTPYRSSTRALQQEIAVQELFRSSTGALQELYRKT